jgi:hypothetical protein
MGSKPDSQYEADGDDEDLAVYRRLWSGDLDEAHDLIVAHGPGILRRGLPYILAATRNRAASQRRRDERRRELEKKASGREERLQDTDRSDPSIALEQRELMASLRLHLSELSNPEVLVLWRRAEGESYATIALEWARLGFGDRPDEATLRQVYHRALEKLRASMATSRPLPTE